MTWDPDMPAIYQSMANFMGTGWPLAIIVIGIGIGGFLMDTLIGLFRRRQG